MTKRLLLLFIMSLGLATAQSQPVSSLLDSAKKYRFSNAEKTSTFSRQAMEKAKATRSLSGQAEGALLFGISNYMSGNRDEALRWYLEAERLYEHAKDSAGMASTYNEQCILYLKEKKINLATDVINKAIKIFSAIGNTDKLGTAYNNKGLIFLDIKKFDTAIALFRAAYTSYKLVNSYMGMSYSLGYQAMAYSFDHQTEKALQCLKESIEIAIKNNDKYAEASGINNIGELFLENHNPAKALAYFNEALAKSKEINFYDLQDNIYKMLAECYRQLGDYKNAYNSTQAEIAVHEKIINDHQLKAIEELQTRYETGKKEQQNKLLTEKNLLQATQLSRNKIINYALIVISLLIMGVLYLFYNRYKLKQQARFQEEYINHEKLRAHAVVDAEENERQRLARELHDGIGQMLAATRRKIASLPHADGDAAVDESIALLDGSIKEVRQLSHNMLPPWLRNKTLVQALEELLSQVTQTSNLKVHSEWVDANQLELNKIQILMLYRSVQEMISNILKHANATSLNIEVVNHDNELNIMVYDNGIGFNKDETTKVGKGIGLKNIQSRIDYIGGQLEIDSYPGKGTTYTIYLPLKNHA